MAGGPGALRSAETHTDAEPIIRVVHTEGPANSGRWALEPCGLGVFMPAAMLCAGPIFEADLPPEIYAYRAGSKLPGRPL